MQHEQEAPTISDETTREAFLGSFGRVPNGLDPVEVYSYFLKQSARVRQLEEQARQTSAPFVLEAALRDASDIRTQAAQAAERTYNEIVGAAQQESQRLRSQSEQQAHEQLEQVSAALTNARHESDELIGAARQEADELLESARQEAERTLQEADRLRRESEYLTDEAEQELERICVDFAGLLQRLVERQKPPATDASSSDAAELPVEAPSSEASAFVGAQFIAPSHDAVGSGPLDDIPAADSPPRADFMAPTPAPPAHEPAEADAPPAAFAPSAPNGFSSGAPSVDETPAAGPTDQVSAASDSATLPPAEPVTDTQSEDREADPDQPAPREERGGFRLPSWLDS